MTNQQALEFIRDEIAQEFLLLNSRMTWFAGCQAFLITAFSISLGNAAIYHAGWMVHYVLPLLGVLLCGAWPGILGACSTIDAWLNQQYKLLSHADVAAEMAPVLIERFLKPPHLDQVHRRSLWFSTFLPALLFAFWVAVLILMRIWPITHPI